MAVYINAGRFKGTKLQIPPTKKGVRVTSSKSREAIMSMLSGSLEGCVFWDVFAGSGAIGLEAISRGAEQAVFFEVNQPSLKALQSNTLHLRSYEPGLCAHIIRGDLMRRSPTQITSSGTGRSRLPAPAGVPRSCQQPDIVFADPPYAITCRWLERYVHSPSWWPGDHLVIQGDVHDQDHLVTTLGDIKNIQAIKTHRYAATVVIHVQMRCQIR